MAKEAKKRSPGIDSGTEIESLVPATDHVV